MRGSLAALLFLLTSLVGFYHFTSPKKHNNNIRLLDSFVKPRLEKTAREFGANSLCLDEILWYKSVKSFTERHPMTDYATAIVDDYGALASANFEAEKENELLDLAERVKKIQDLILIPNYYPTQVNLRCPFNQQRNVSAMTNHSMTDRLLLMKILILSEQKSAHVDNFLNIQEFRVNLNLGVTEAVLGVIQISQLLKAIETLNKRDSDLSSSKHLVYERLNELNLSDFYKRVFQSVKMDTLKNIDSLRSPEKDSLRAHTPILKLGDTEFLHFDTKDFFSQLDLCSRDLQDQPSGEINLSIPESCKKHEKSYLEKAALKLLKWSIIEPHHFAVFSPGYLSKLLWNLLNIPNIIRMVNDTKEDFNYVIGQIAKNR